MKNKQRVIITMMMLMLASCQTDKYEQEYERFSAYMQEVHHVEKAADGLYAVLPVVACNACNEELIEALNSAAYRQVYIIITSMLKAEAAPYRQRLASFALYTDTNEEIHKQQITNRLHPFLIEVAEGKITTFMEVDYSQNMDKALKLLNKFVLDEKV